MQKQEFLVTYKRREYKGEVIYSFIVENDEFLYVQVEKDKEQEFLENLNLRSILCMEYYFLTTGNTIIKDYYVTDYAWRDGLLDFYLDEYKAGKVLKTFEECICREYLGEI